MIHSEELKRQSDRILRLITTAEESFDEGDEMRSHLAKYVCIQCSGFLENAVHYIYIDYVKKETASAPVISFSSVQLNKVNNPNSDKLKEIARSFCAEWEPLLNRFMMEEDRSSAINYIMKERHKVAHGKDSDITLSRIRGYHLKTVEVVEFIEHQCGLVPVVVPVPVPEAMPLIGLEPVPVGAGADAPGAA